MFSVLGATGVQRDGSSRNRYEVHSVGVWSKGVTAFSHERKVAGCDHPVRSLAQNLRETALTDTRLTSHSHNHPKLAKAQPRCRFRCRKR